MFRGDYIKSNVGDFFDTFSEKAWNRILDNTYWTTSVKSSENIKKESDKTIIEIELAGYKKENIKVVTTGKLLEVVAIGNRGEKSYNYTLTDSADVSKISSKFEDAILTIEIPVKESAKPKEVKIL